MHLEPRRQAARAQAVIAADAERRIEAAHRALPVMIEQGGLAVHGLRRARDRAACLLDDRLMTEADPQQRQFALRERDQFQAAARVARLSRSRREHDQRIRLLRAPESIAGVDPVPEYRDLAA